MHERKVAIVTGASGGIGRATAEHLMKAGYVVYGISRHPQQWGGLHCIAADVCDESMIAQAMAEIYRAQGRIDLLVSNAGFGISGAIEQTELSDAKRQLDVNFFGFFNCAKQVLPYMRAQGSGCIVAVSSVAGALAIPFQAFYSASKAAINSFVLSLANEVRPFGIRVLAVMPGDVRTGFTAAREKGKIDEASPYAERLERSVSGMERDEQNGMTPDYVAKRICRAAHRRHPRPFYTIGGKYRLFTFLAKLLPAKLCNWVVGKLYAA